MRWTSTWWGLSLRWAVRLGYSSPLPGASRHQFIHCLIGKLRFRGVAANHEHEDRFRIGITLGDVLEPARDTRRKRHDVQRADIDVISLAVLVLPAAAPFP